MLCKSFVGSFMLHIMFFALCSSAPTHHLSIGVQGNTPTLFVTSAELGITSEIERAPLKVSKARKDLKTLNEKGKTAKVKNSIKSKKTIYFSKNTIVTTSAPFELKDILSTQSMHLESTTQPDVLSSRITETVRPTATMSTVNFTTTTEQILTTTINENDNVSTTKLTQTTANEVPLLTATIPAKTASSTPNPRTDSSIEATAISTSTVAPPRRTSPTHNESVEMATTEATEATNATAIHEDKNVDNSNQSENLQNNSFEKAMSTPASIQQSTNGAFEQTSTTSENFSRGDATKLQTDNNMEMETSLTSMPFNAATSTLIALPGKLTQTATETIVKLIDLEKHNTKTFENIKKAGPELDNGHDGLKTIKKKQLIDKHYLELINGNKEEDILEDPSTDRGERKHAFLGPIIMAERLVPASSPLPQISASTESQLPNDHLIELKNTQSLKIVPNLNGMPSNKSMNRTKMPANIIDAEVSPVLSTTVFEVPDTVATKIPSKAASTMFTSTIDEDGGELISKSEGYEKIESKISDIQIEVYDSTIDSIVASTNFKDSDIPPGKSTKPPLSVTQQERFTQYIIDRTETSTQESINFSTIQVASGKPEPAAIEIHINVSESFGNDSEDVDVSFPQSEYNNNGRNGDTSYDDAKVDDDIKLKIPSNMANAGSNKDRSDEVLVVEIVDSVVDNTTESKGKIKSSDDLFITEVKETYNTPPPPPPPPPFQTNFDRDSDTIFYISNTEVKVGETLSSAQKAFEERKMKLENQFFPANYMASTHPNVNTGQEAGDRHLYEEDIILSSSRNQADSLKIYRNRNEPSPPLDVTYVGESIIEVEQSPDTSLTSAFPTDHVITPQPDVIIQPAILPEISIGVPVIGELPPQIELKEIDFMPNEAQLHHSGVYGNGNLNDDSNSGNNINVNGISVGNSDIDNRIDESSIQYGGDLIDESADGGFDGVEGSYPFGNPVSMTKRNQNHGADYAHLYVNYGVNNMRKDELTADVKDSGEVSVILERNAGNVVNSNDQNVTSKEFFNKALMLNNTVSLNESERMSNVTAFSIMDLDDKSDDLDDKSTEDFINLISLAIGLFIVILPVVVTCSMFWALRYLYKKYHTNSADSNGNLDPADMKSPPNGDAAEKGEFVHVSAPHSTHNDKDEIQKCPESLTNPSADKSIVKFTTDLAPPLDSPLETQCKGRSRSLPRSRDFPRPLALHPSMAGEVHDEILQGPNGSVTKMTLENNLLIVETEERNDMSRVARETKMDYNKDGVFVVEVSRGIDSKSIPDSPVTDGNEKMLSMFETKHNGNGALGYKIANEKISHNNEKVQIHSPPPEKTDEGPRSLHQIEEVDENVPSPRLNDVGDKDGIEKLYKSNTGLSQSDLSSTSSNDSNKDYCYGNQELYVVEQSGYSASSPGSNVVLKCDTKDIKDDDRNPENGRYLEHSPDKKEDAKETEDVMDAVNMQNKSAADTIEEKSAAHNQKVEEDKQEAMALPSAKDDEVVDTLTILNNQNDVVTADQGSSVQDEVRSDLCPSEQKEDINDANVEKLKAEDVEEKMNQPIVDEAEIRSEQKIDINDANVEKLKAEDIEEKMNQPIFDEAEIIDENVTSLTIQDEVPGQKDDINGPNVEKLNAEDRDEKMTEPVAEEDQTIDENLTPLTIQVDATKEEIKMSPIKETHHLKDNQICAENKINTTKNEIKITSPIIEIHDLKDNQICAENANNATKEAIKLSSSIPETHDLKDNQICAENENNAIKENSSAEEETQCNGHAEVITIEKSVPNGSSTHDEDPPNISPDLYPSPPKINSENNSNNNLHLDVITSSQKQENIETVDIIAETTIFEAELGNSKSLNSDLLPDLVPSKATIFHTNGDEVQTESHNNCITEFENGYDSIMSLPEPPPTTDETLCSDLSDHQLDSLPPPPPPLVNDLNGETFTLKDLPPPLANSGAESLSNEDANNFYATLPPPPPTTLHVSNHTPTMNGNMHASPLTPPASPPPHFTNGLHGGICPPIAVDVNGS